MKRSLRAACMGLLVAMAAGAQASDWPARPITWVVPYPPGGSTDILARLVGVPLGEQLGTSVIIENRAGAGGNVGTEYAVRQPADGYTIVMGNIGPISINPSLYPDLPYEPQRDLQPVTLIASVPNLLVANPELQVRSVSELLAYAKGREGPLSYATPGVGTSLHLAGELFSSTTGLRLSHVPYRGSAPGLNDVAAGHVPIMFDNMPSALQLVKAGRLQALAITSGVRSPLLPDVPTMAEAGLKDYEITGWFGVLAPSGTPEPVIARLNEALQAVLQQPKVRERIAELGGILPDELGPAPFGRYIASETEKWGDLVRTAKITPQ